MMLPEINIGDIVQLRKVHPCGSLQWKIFRLGADIGLECLGCGRRVLLPRRTLAQRMKKLITPTKEENGQTIE
ncbi:MAG TPA: DUF951 domain-containing protein [Anaerolineales bacterium]|nr:DUF951 domain-containing protein [Anaerolineales bacterium]